MINTNFMLNMFAGNTIDVLSFSRIYGYSLLRKQKK